MNLLSEYKSIQEPAINSSGTDLLIHLEDVSIRFRIPHERIPSIKEYAIRRLRRSITYHDFWALRHINLEVHRGEVFGIVGPNGAGKSTLLKVVSRVLRPTEGRIRIRGHVAPLLELGAGFDYELTGRENIFLNGAILGFTHQDIAGRLERIIDFAGLRDFINSPMRTYSTGMIARLGFSVATDVQPEILIIDEILSVGDVEFQQKSAARIKAFGQNGTTIFLVSHSLEVVQTMCTRAAWLSHGELKSVGDAREVVKSYQNDTAAG
jgi:ABC-type polysaccharide/polyol phosphate transport system ATPase subunit